MLTDFLATLAAASPAVSSPRKAKTVPPPLPAQALAPPPPSRNGEGGEDRRAKQARHTELLAVIGCDPLFFSFAFVNTPRAGWDTIRILPRAVLSCFFPCCDAAPGKAPPPTILRWSAWSWSSAEPPQARYRHSQLV